MNFLSCLIVEAAFALSSTLVLSQTLGFPAFTFPIPSPGQLCGKWAGAAVRCSTASLLVINHNTGKKYWELKIFFLSSLNTHLRPCLTLETCKELPKGHIGRTHSILLVLYVAEVAGRYWAKWSLIGQKMPWKHNFYKHYQNNILIKKIYSQYKENIFFPHPNSLSHTHPWSKQSPLCTPLHPHANSDPPHKHIFVSKGQQEKADNKKEMQ